MNDSLLTFGRSALRPEPCLRFSNDGLVAELSYAHITLAPCPPKRLIRGAPGIRRAGRRVDKYWKGGRKVWADNDRFTGAEHWNELRRASIEITAGALNRVAVLLVGQAMNEQGPELAEDVMRDVARSLGGQHAGEPVLAAFFCNQAE